MENILGTAAAIIRKPQILVKEHYFSDSRLSLQNQVGDKVSTYLLLVLKLLLNCLQTSLSLDLFELSVIKPSRRQASQLNFNLI